MKQNWLMMILTLTFAVSEAQDRIHIFGLGSSFMEDMIARVPELTSTYQDRIDLNYLLLWGAGIDEHLELIDQDDKKYVLYHYNNEKRCWQTDSVRFSEVIDTEKWDAILLQQSSQYSGFFDKTRIKLSKLLKVLKAHHPQAKYYWHLSWSYSKDSDHPSFSMYDNSQDKMYFNIVKTGSQIIRETFHDDFAGYIPTGPVIQELRQSTLDPVNDFCRDGYHLSLTIGRYATACTFYESVLASRLHRSILETNETPEDSLHTPEDYDFIRQTVYNVVHNDSLVWGEIESDRIYKTNYYDASGRPIYEPGKTGFQVARYYHVSGKTSSEKIFRKP